jgi:hypothetical protein
LSERFLHAPHTVERLVQRFGGADLHLMTLFVANRTFEVLLSLFHAREQFDLRPQHVPAMGSSADAGTTAGSGRGVVGVSIGALRSARVGHGRESTRRAPRAAARPRIIVRAFGSG